MVTVANRDVPTLANRHRDAEGYGAVWTKHTPDGIKRGGYLEGALPSRLKDILSERADHITQVIYSYRTPIAWEDDGVWILPRVGYSTTTAKHQSHVRNALNVRQIPWDAGKDEYARVLQGHARFDGTRYYGTGV